MTKTKKAAPKKATTKKTTKAAPKIKTVEDTPAGAVEVQEGKPEAGATKKKAKKGADKAPKKMSAIDAAAKVLEEAKEPLSTKQMIEEMAAKGYWTSPGGQTPHATLYSAILREIATKGKDARFKKTERGRFALN